MNNTLIPVVPGRIGAHTCMTVDGRTLHTFLEVGKDFSTWMSARIQQYGFGEGEDFELDSPILGNQSGRGGDRRSKEYRLTLNMAKELAMVERTPRGQQARRYFIACEAELLALKGQANATPQADALVRGAAPVDKALRTGPVARPAAPYAPGANVRRLREQLNLSQRQLARLCFPAVTPTTIARLEQNDGYQMETLERVSVALGTTIEVLLAPPTVFSAKTKEGVSPLDLVDLDRLQQLMCTSAWLARRYLLDYGATAAWLDGFMDGSQEHGHD